jgi:hypothetical protein
MRWTACPHRLPLRGGYALGLGEIPSAGKVKLGGAQFLSSRDRTPGRPGSKLGGPVETLSYPSQTQPDHGPSRDCAVFNARTPSDSGLERSLLKQRERRPRYQAGAPQTPSNRRQGLRRSPSSRQPRHVCAESPVAGASTGRTACPQFGCCRDRATRGHGKASHHLGAPSLLGAFTPRTCLLGGDGELGGADCDASDDRCGHRRDLPSVSPTNPRPPTTPLRRCGCWHSFAAATKSPPSAEALEVPQSRQ